MPNPLFGVGQLNRSKQPTDRPAPVAPDPEHQYAGEVNPYRGIENHGVASKQEPYEDYWGQEGRMVVVYAQEPDDSVPVPVRVVTGDHSREYREWRADRQTVTGTIRQIIGRDDARKSMKIINMDAAKTIYLSPNADDAAIFGYPLGPGKDQSFTAESPVYAVSADGASPVQIGIMVEYVVTE